MRHREWAPLSWLVDAFTGVFRGIDGGKTTMRILVSGGSSGIGAAIAAAGIARGHHVFAGGRRFRTLQCSSDADGRLVEIPLDVLDSSSCRAAVDEMKKRVGGVDVLVASAGIAAAGAFEETPAEEFHRLMDVNFYGAIRTIKAVLPEMRAAKGGLVIVISSLSGLVGLPGDSAYAASKFALEGACEALAPEVARFGVEVVIVQPGGVDTPLLETAPPAPGALTGDYGAFNAFLRDRAHNRRGGAGADEIAAEILGIIENRGGPLRRPVGDQARKTASLLPTLSDAGRRQLALDASGLQWWRDGEDPP